MSRHIVLLVIILSLVLAAPVFAAESGNGKIEGSVVNGTKNGSSVANQDIVLRTYFNNKEVSSATTKTDAIGKFQFSGLSTKSGYSYVVSLQYQEAEYISERITFDKDKTTKPVTITVYDSTTSDEAIKVAMFHTVIYVGQGSLLVKEYFLFVNEGDRTYIGSKIITGGMGKETLRFSLPEGATELQFASGLMGCCIIPTEEGFVDTMPVIPGAIRVAFSYTLPYSSETYIFSRKVNYPTANFNLLVHGEGIEVVSGQLTLEGLLDMGGTQFIHLSGKNLTPGTILTAYLSGLSGANTPRVLLWVVAGLAILILGFGFSYRWKKLQPVSPEDSLDQKKRQSLLLKIAQLDDDFENGKIPEEIYHRLRTKTKAQLIELMLQVKRKE